MKLFFRRLFYSSHSSSFFRVNNFLTIVTIVTIAALVLETVESLERYMFWFRGIEWVATFIFTFEYIGRIWGNKKPFRYIFSFFGLIDLVAILPTYFGLGNLTFLKSLRWLRIFRFLRMLRLAKVLELQTLKQNGTEFDKKSYEDRLFLMTLQIYMTLFIATALLAATLIWIFEGDRSVFANIPLSLLWSLKVLLGGAPQALPDTVFGELVVIVTRFFGVVLFALLINIILNPVKKYVLAQQED
jgi:voltage-gated potassium channel